MASIFRYRGKKTWWVSYYLNGKRFRHSLKTTNRKIALRMGSRVGGRERGRLVRGGM